MKRREFLNLTAGSVAASAIPLPTAALPVREVSVNGKYIWAVAAAKAQNCASAGLLQSQLKIGAAEAEALMARMAQSGVITAPNTAGVSRAVAPVFYGPGMTQAAPITSAAAAKQPPQNTLRDVANHMTEDGPTASDDDPARPEALDEAHSIE